MTEIRCESARTSPAVSSLIYREEKQDSSLIPLNRDLRRSLFGLMHGVFFFGAIGAIKAFLLISYTGLVAFIMAYINEKKADGSIFPSWAIHACANIVSSVFALFSIL